MVEVAAREVSIRHGFKMVVDTCSKEGKFNVDWEAGDMGWGCGRTVNSVKERKD